MQEVIKTKVDGVEILVDAEPTVVYGSERTSASPTEKTLENAEQAMTKAQTTVASISSGFISTLRRLDDWLTPDEFTLEFGLKFSLEGNVIVTKVGGEATLKVTLKYVHKAASSSSEDKSEHEDQDQGK